MRNVVVFSIVLLAGLAGAFCWRDQAARKQLEAGLSEIKKLSTELALARLATKESEQTNTVLQSALTRQTQQMGALSNRFNEASLREKAAEQTARSAQEKEQEFHTKLAQIEAEVQSLTSEKTNLIATVRERDAQFQASQETVKNTETKHQETLSRLQKATAEIDQLTQRFNDLFTVQAQLEKLKQAQNRKDWVWRRKREEHLELQPDGTVTLRPASTNVFHK